MKLKAPLAEDGIPGNGLRSCGGNLTRAAAPAWARAPVQDGPVLSGIGAYLWHGQFLSRNRICQAMTELFGVPVSPGTVTAMVIRVSARLGPVLKRIRERVAAVPLAHFDETGFRVAGKLAWVHSASMPGFSLITVHPRRGTEGMDAAGVLPQFRGIACHDAWAPYDTYEHVAGHALCGAHVLRELAGAGENGTAADAQWLGQAAPDPAILARHSHLLRSAALIGARANGAGRTKIEKKARALRSMTGAGHFCAIRSYLATAAKHGTSALDALIRAAEGQPWLPGTA